MNALVGLLVSQCGKDEMKLIEVVDQLIRCGFECEAGPLVLNTAFIDLATICATCKNGPPSSTADRVMSPRCTGCVRNPNLHDSYQANAHALAEERSDDSQKRVVGSLNQKGGGR